MTSSKVLQMKVSNILSFTKLREEARGPRIGVAPWTRATSPQHGMLISADRCLLLAGLSQVSIDPNGYEVRKYHELPNAEGDHC